MPTGAGAQGPPLLSVSSETVIEGSAGTTAVEFEVALDQNAPAIIVNISTEDVTASAPADYEGTTMNNVALVPGQPQTVTVRVAGDARDEPDETFKLKAASAVNPADTNAEGTGTIVDDDPNRAPTARVDVNPQRAYMGKVIEFNGSRSSDPEGGPLQYTWHLDGNGSFETPTGSESAIGLAFFSTGLQAVGLRVTDVAAKTDSETGYALIFAPPAGAPRDTTRPSTHLFPVRKSLRRALRGGIRVRFGCSEACLIAGSVGVDRRTGRRIGLEGRNRTMGRGFSAMPRAGSRVFTLKLSRRARRALTKVRKVPVNLRFVVRDGASNVRITNHRLTLRR